MISVETTLLHPRRGFIKLEDTVVVTAAATKSMVKAPAAGTGAARRSAARSGKRRAGAAAHQEPRRDGEIDRFQASPLRNAAW